MLKNDKWIATQARRGMIAPFVPRLIRRDGKRHVLSYGLSSYGYDLRLSPRDFRIFRHVPGAVVDPKNFTAENLEKARLHRDTQGAYFILPAHTYGLGVAMEKLAIPENITVICIGKSTYARIGCIANVTPAEAAWRGYLTLEFSNSSDADIRIYAGEGVVQLLFFEGEPCETTYATRSGKYQGQKHEVTLPRV